MKLENNMLQQTLIRNYTTSGGTVCDIPVSYQVFGRPLHTAPVVLINHALTGNSDVSGENGWWKKLVGGGKLIDTRKFTVLCFNIPGNGYDNFFIENYQDLTARDVACILIYGIKSLNISKLYALIGGSLGGAIGWEMLVLEPDLTKYFVPIATDYKTTDWLYSQCLVQKFLLENPENPLEKARIHAMLCYRTPESLNLRFNREISEENQKWKSHEWLDYHGRALKERFAIKAYRLVNHLLMTINADPEKLKNIKAEIYLISVNTDLFFPDFEIQKTYQLLKHTNHINYHTISSIHGHDAFLMEYEQLIEILKPIFENDRA